MAASDRMGRSRPTLILLVLTTITLLTLDFRNFGPLESIQGGIRTVMSPVVGLADSVVSPFGASWQGITDYDDLLKENEGLRAEIDELRGQAVRGQAAEATLDQILSELDIDYLQGADRVTARVGDNMGNFDDFAIHIDKGSSDDIEEGMTAVTSAGLVGRVSAVTPDQSRIELMTENDFGVGVRILGTNDLALARGQGRGKPLLISENIDENTEIEVGMAVITAGLDGSPFAGDLPVGVVSSVEVDPVELQVQVEIEPLANLDRLSFVTVILWTNSE